jgi:hypothetical protein
MNCTISFSVWYAPGNFENFVVKISHNFCISPKCKGKQSNNNKYCYLLNIFNIFNNNNIIINNNLAQRMISLKPVSKLQIISEKF